jgi:hypothetical protein
MAQVGQHDDEGTERGEFLILRRSGAASAIDERSAEFIVHSGRFSCLQCELQAQGEGRAYARDASTIVVPRDALGAEMATALPCDMATYRRQPPLLSRDALVIYRLLRRRVPSQGARATITYRDLGRRVGIPHRSRRMDAALLELVLWCRTNSLPAIAALVVLIDRGVPGPGYYGVAHGLPPTPMPALAWAREVVAVCSTSYP